MHDAGNTYSTCHRREKPGGGRLAVQASLEVASATVGAALITGDDAAATPMSTLGDATA
jgi:hypothetical protein